MIKFEKCQCEVSRGDFKINEVPLDCPAVWQLLATGNTVGVFQLEKNLGQDWSKKTRSASIEELSALTALLRPGPLESNMTQDYVDIKFKRKSNSYIHPALKLILDPTYGCLVYQEQAIKIATDLAGLSPESADELRKAIGKKKPELMAKIKSKFIEGAQKHKNIGRGVAEEIFGWIEKCQRYSFNKSHAVSYGMIAYHTAWAKCHFPHEFFTSYLTFSNYKSDPKDEIYRLVQDARLFGVDIFPPDITRGNIDFEMTNSPQKGVAFGLSHIRGVGSTAIQKIAEAGPGSLKTWTDFLSSVPSFHRNVGIALIKSGACDCYGMSRNSMVRELEVILGTTARNMEGKKIEIKGLTPKEKDYFFEYIRSEQLTAREVLLQMSQPASSKTKSISQMLKSELLGTAREYLSQAATAFETIKIGDGTFVYTSDDEKDAWLDSLSKLKKTEIKQIMIDNGYVDKVVKPPCSSDARRRCMAEKAELLEHDIEDTNTAKSTAEKYFLGIALSCSPTDDVNNSVTTHTCLEVAHSPNDEHIVVCAIIDSVKHTKTKRGKNPGQPMCFLTMSDSTYSIDHAVVFPDSFCKLKAFCKEDMICLIYGEKKNGSFIVKDIQKIM